MTFWEIAAAVLPLALLPCGLSLLRGTALARVAALQVAISISAFELVAVGAATGQPFLADLAICTVVVGNAGTFVFARMFRAWV